MDHSSITTDVALCIVLAWGLAILAQLARQPLILAYLVAGYIIKPGNLNWVRDQSSIETISGLGLILLLFMIGLEIDLKKMLSAGKLIISAAVGQVVISIATGIAFFLALGFSLSAGKLDALYLAMAAALSSTVIIVKILYEKRELDTLPGRITLGVLVLQDLFAILFLAVQPNLGNPSIQILLLSCAKVVVLIAVVLLASRYLLPPLFRTVARLPELVLVGSLAWCFLVAGFAHMLGLSQEMGALVAGVGISTFPYTLDVVAKVTSIRDFFVTLFFVGLGMSIPAPTPVLLGLGVLTAFFVVFTRFATVFPLLHWMKQGHRASLLPALHLSQISELSLVILALGVKSSHIGVGSSGVIAYAFAILAVFSSYAIVKSDSLVVSLSRLLTRLKIPDLGGTGAESGEGSHARPKILLLGFSWTASSLLEEISRRYPDRLEELAVIDFNPTVHEELKRRGIRAIYGDISQRDTLLHAGAGTAEVLVCSLPNMVLKGINNLRLVQQLRELNPDAQIIAHAELFGDVSKLYTAGASFVSLPRMIEAAHLCEAIEAARQNLLEQKSAALHKELENRKEVIP